MDSSSSSGMRLCGLPGACLALFVAAVGLSIGVTAFVVFRTGDSRLSAEQTVDLRQGAAPQIAASAPRREAVPVLRVAVAPVVSPATSLEMYADLVAHIARQTGRQPVFLRGRSYSRVNDLIRMRQCDVAMICTFSYVLTRDELGARLLAAPVIGGETVYYGFIVVPAGSTASGLLDLRGRRFASSDILSCSGWLYPMARLKQAGADPFHFFSEHLISGSHDRSVFAVNSGVVDGAAVDSIVYERMLASDPGLGKSLKVIERSAAFGMPPFVMPAGTPEELFSQLRLVLLEMHENVQGQEVLRRLGFDRFVVPKDEDYASVRETYRQWQGQP